MTQIYDGEFVAIPEPSQYNSTVREPTYPFPPTNVPTEAHTMDTVLEESGSGETPGAPMACGHYRDKVGTTETDGPLQSIGTYIRTFVHGKGGDHKDPDWKDDEPACHTEEDYEAAEACRPDEETLADEMAKSVTRVNQLDDQDARNGCGIRKRRLDEGNTVHGELGHKRVRTEGCGGDTEGYSATAMGTAESGDDSEINDFGSAGSGTDMGEEGTIDNLGERRIAINKSLMTRTNKYLVDKKIIGNIDQMWCIRILTNTPFELGTRGYEGLDEYENFNSAVKLNELPRAQYYKVTVRLTIGIRGHQFILDSLQNAFENDFIEFRLVAFGVNEFAHGRPVQAFVAISGTHQFKKSNDREFAVEIAGERYSTPKQGDGAWMVLCNDSGQVILVHCHRIQYIVCGSDLSLAFDYIRSACSGVLMDVNLTRGVIYSAQMHHIRSVSNPIGYTSVHSFIHNKLCADTQFNLCMFDIGITVEVNNCVISREPVNIVDSLNAFHPVKGMGTIVIWGANAFMDIAESVIWKNNGFHIVLVEWIDVPGTLSHVETHFNTMQMVGPICKVDRCCNIAAVQQHCVTCLERYHNKVPIGHAMIRRYDRFANKEEACLIQTFNRYRSIYHDTVTNPTLDGYIVAGIEAVYRKALAEVYRKFIEPVIHKVPAEVGTDHVYPAGSFVLVECTKETADDVEMVVPNSPLTRSIEGAVYGAKLHTAMSCNLDISEDVKCPCLDNNPTSCVGNVLCELDNNGEMESESESEADLVIDLVPTPPLAGCVTPSPQSPLECAPIIIRKPPTKRRFVRSTSPPPIITPLADDLMYKIEVLANAPFLIMPTVELFTTLQIQRAMCGLAPRYNNGHLLDETIDLRSFMEDESQGMCLLFANECTNSKRIYKQTSDMYMIAEPFPRPDHSDPKNMLSPWNPCKQPYFWFSMNDTCVEQRKVRLPLLCNLVKSLYFTGKCGTYVDEKALINFFILQIAKMWIPVYGPDGTRANDGNGYMLTTSFLEYMGRMETALDMLPCARLVLVHNLAVVHTPQSILKMHEVLPLLAKELRLHGIEMTFAELWILRVVRFMQMLMGFLKGKADKILLSDTLCQSITFRPVLFAYDVGHLDVCNVKKHWLKSRFGKQPRRLSPLTPKCPPFTTQDGKRYKGHNHVANYTSVVPLHFTLTPTHNDKMAITIRERTGVTSSNLTEMSMMKQGKPVFDTLTPYYHRVPWTSDGDLDDGMCMELAKRIPVKSNDGTP